MGPRCRTTMTAEIRPLSRKHSFMPGYGGCVQHEYSKIASTFGKAAQASYIESLNMKSNPRASLKCEETYTANDYYVGAPDPRKKTNSKNRSNLTLGDPRAQTFDTINMTAYRQRDLPMTRAPLVDGFAEMEVEARDKVYRRALERCGVEGVRKLEHDIRVKIDQRTSGGPFALRKAFKYFDRDGSGDIDPDEFCAAMDFFGLQFTEDAVLGLFGLYDDDRGGSLGYYEFVDNIITSNKQKQGGEVFKDKCSSLLSPKSPSSPVCRSPTSVDKDLAKACFDMADKNGSGKIELSELEDMFKQFGVPTDSDVLNKAFVHLDKNFDGEISFDEFWQWWETTVTSYRPRGGVGEQGRPTQKQLDKMAAKNGSLVGRSGIMDSDMAPKRSSSSMMHQPRLLPPSMLTHGRSQSSTGGFASSHPRQMKRPSSRGGGDVLANC